MAVAEAAEVMTKTLGRCEIQSKGDTPKLVVLQELGDIP